MERTRVLLCYLLDAVLRPITLDGPRLGLGRNVLADQKDRAVDVKPWG